jgi:hypothetical protein
MIEAPAEMNLKAKFVYDGKMEKLLSLVQFLDVKCVVLIVVLMFFGVVVILVINVK